MVQIKEEIQKSVEVGFISPIQHPIWLANIVHVKKKNCQVHHCINFNDLNKRCPQDDFALPNMDMLIGVIVWHSMFHSCMVLVAIIRSRCTCMMQKRNLVEPVSTRFLHNLLKDNFDNYSFTMVV